MNSDCKKYVLGCSQCRLFAPHVPSGRGEYGSWARKANMVWDMLMIDFASWNNQNILLVIDCYSHWLFSFVTDNQEASTVASKLRELFMIIGIPAKIICDNGPHFVNEILKRLSDKLGFTISTGSTYHPQRQGLVERSVREIKSSLSKLDETNTLEEQLKLINMVHNISPFSFAPDFSPYLIVYGRQPRWLSSEPYSDNQEPIDQLRLAWDQCRDVHYSANNDRNMLIERKTLSEGMKVIWRSGGFATFRKLAKREGSNHWRLTDGHVVPEEQLQAFIDEVADLRISTARSRAYEINDLVLFHRDDCLDIGRVIGFDDSSNSIQLVNLYMDDAGRWAEHGDSYQDSVSEDSVIKKVLLTKSGKLDRRFL